MSDNTFSFNKYVCVGDTSTVEHGKYSITARIEFDHDARPTDYECYEQDEIDAWNNDDWFYCGVVLSVSYNGVEICDHAASLWGIEANITDDNNHIAEEANNMLDEALKYAEAGRARMREALA